MYTYQFHFVKHMVQPRAIKTTNFGLNVHHVVEHVRERILVIPRYIAAAQGVLSHQLMPAGRLTMNHLLMSESALPYT